MVSCPEQLPNNDERRFYNTLQKCGCWWKKNVIVALNSYWMPLKHFQSCILEMVKLIIKPGDIFPPEVWSSIRFLCINCKFSRCLDQVSHRNNKPLSFLDSWHGIKFEFALQISSSGRRKWFFTQLTGPLEFYYQWYLTFKLHTLFFWAEMTFSLHTMRGN